MRWILVFIFLYLIPLMVLFKNYNNFKRSCIYSSIYIVLATTIVISNVYMSGLNKIEEAMYYQNYANEERYKENQNLKSIKDNNEEIAVDNDIESPDRNNEKITLENQIQQEDKSKEETTKEAIHSKSDIEIIREFKTEIYEIEKIALMPMRECMPYTKNISANLKKLMQIKGDIEYAKEKCEEAIGEYDSMEIPKLSRQEYTSVLESGRKDLKNTYELRAKAMESAISLVDTKNPKHIGKITEYLNLSDSHIESFKNRLSDLENNIYKNQATNN